MANIALLRAELTADPLGRGYSGMTAEQAATSLNTANRPRDRTGVSPSEIMGAIKPADYPTDTRMQHYLSTLLGTGPVELDGSNVRAALLAIFVGKTDTLTALAALQSANISRAVELGIGLVREGTILEARM